MVAVIDYDLGNLQSVSRALQISGAEVKITSTSSLIREASAIVLPGVGAFLKGIENLRKRGILEVIVEEVKNGKLFLGICLGLQLLFTRSEEHSIVLGMNLIEGEVVRFTHSLKIPHIGWNQVEYKENEVTNRLFENIPQHSYFYFVHSYYVKPKEEDITVATTYYGEIFPSVIVRNNIIGVQFHPEKSGKIGLEFLKNFLKFLKKKNAC